MTFRSTRTYRVPSRLFALSSDPFACLLLCPLSCLQGHIAIDSAVFPEGTPGFVLDAYARRALWAEGLDYAHGTGTFLFFHPMPIIAYHMCICSTGASSPSLPSHPY